MKGRIGVVLAMATAWVAMGSGCRAGPTVGARPSGAPSPIESTNQPTPEQVRQALAAMITSLPEDHPARSTLDAVKTWPVKLLDEGHIGVGPWDCDMKRLRFHFLLDHPPVFFLMEGDVVPGEDGTWKAVVTRTVRN